MKGQLRPVTEDDKLPDEAVTSLAEDTIQEGRRERERESESERGGRERQKG